MECAYHPGVEAAAVCRNCGRPVCSDCTMEIGGKLYCRPCVSRGAGLPKKPPGPSGTAITAFVLSVVGFAVCITAIPGFILGLSELKKIRAGQSSEAGRGFALAAAIIGGILTGITLLVIIFYIIVIIIAIVAS